MDQIDRLTTISKHLYDNRVVEQRREIEKLKKEIENLKKRNLIDLWVADVKTKGLISYNSPISKEIGKISFLASEISNALYCPATDERIAKILETVEKSSEKEFY